MSRNYEDGMSRRTERLLGRDVVEKIRNTRVIVFGIGGVGGWCVEALVRSGIRKITVVDSDKVCTTNINRQVIATSTTVGTPKVEAVKQRILEINPEAEVTAINNPFNEETASTFRLEDYDVIIDAIDSLKDKILLIRKATETDAAFFSSMGAALKTDPTQVKVAEFWKVRGCPLAAALRRTFKRMGCRPAKKFLCVFSEELLKNKGADKNGDNNTQPCGETTAAASPINKPHTNGSLVQVTAPAGFTLASLVINNICQAEQ